MPNRIEKKGKNAFHQNDMVDERANEAKRHEIELDSTMYYSTDTIQCSVDMSVEA